MRPSITMAALAAALAVTSVATVAPAASPTASAARAAEAGHTTGVVLVSARIAYGRGVSAGTGVVLTSSGTVLTNNHVIRGAGSVRVTDVSTGRTYSATVAGYSIAKDVALLRLRGASGLATVRTGSTTEVGVGDPVTAVGAGGGGARLRTVAGEVTALAQSITVNDGGSPVRLTRLIETSAALRPGDSGGPLLKAGRVIGINAATSGGLTSHEERHGYAIPIDVVLSVARQIETGRSTTTVHVGPTAFLGVALGETSYVRKGVRGAIVERVVDGSPADRAGIGRDDLIVAFAGRRITSPDDLRRLIQRSRPRRVVSIVWIDPYRGRTSATVRLVAGPPQ